MNVEEAELFCKENNIEIRGKLCWDCYIGWIDKSEFYRDENCGPYLMICDLNIADNLCCEEICSDYPCDEVKNKGETK